MSCASANCSLRRSLSSSNLTEEKWREGEGGRGREREGEGGREKEEGREEGKVKERVGVSGKKRGDREVKGEECELRGVREDVVLTDISCPLSCAVSP